jgi:2-dehydropantoate 2-reductase
LKILVLGAGGIGGYFGARLVEAGVDVTFLVRPRRQEQLARDGLVVESPLGNLKIPVKTVRADEPTLSPALSQGRGSAGYDFVLFTCKAYDLDSAMDAIAPAMKGGATVVPMLNGISHFERLDARFGKGNVLGGTCQINATLRKDGTIVHGDPLQRMIFGERDRTRSARAESFARAVAGSKIDGQLSEDIEQDLWEKVVFLSALAATTTLFRGNVREIMAAPGGREAMERALAANVEVAKAEGHAPREIAIQRAKQRLTDPEGLWSASMLRDLEGGGQVEADHVVGYMLGLARKHQVDDTMLSLAYTHLKAYEARRAAGRLPGAVPA